ncbi:MAG: SDR family NAD(P)-dependent oxidoreductase [Chitinispirillaceae bacterium]|nr:SDR family NAD(P)-dependent oxidoreductase [Chitinispirillaceae bacterium]
MSRLPKAILITAGTKRLGFHFAQASLAMGYSVVLHFRSSNRTARQWVQHHPEYNGKVFYLQQDLTEQPQSLIQRVRELPCRLTGLVNNASLFSRGDLFNQTHLRSMLEIHFFTPAQLGACFAEQISNGWIINITDALACRSNTSWQNYRMSKLFLEELTRQQAIRFAPDCRVNAIAPGAVLPSKDTKGASFRNLAANIPLRKTSSVAAITEAFRFLVTNTSCTGQIIRIDGGWHLTA